MTKKEIIWRHILIRALEKKQPTFTQKEIAQYFKISTSTVFNALKAPRKLGAVEVTGRFFRLTDAEKLLILWATMRNITKDIQYSTYVPGFTAKIEGNTTGDTIFGAFSAYRLKYNDAPADYDQVYIYSDNLEELKKRFPPIKNKQQTENLFVLKPDHFLSSFGHITPDVQTFVDIWNIPKWYAKDFLNSLKEKLNI